MLEASLHVVFRRHHNQPTKNIRAIHRGGAVNLIGLCERINSWLLTRQTWFNCAACCQELQTDRTAMHGA